MVIYQKRYITDNVKVIEVLEKIEQLEKDGDKVYWNKIVRSET